MKATSPQVYARAGGFLYLIVIVVGLFAEAFVRSRLVVGHDAAATARNILASESLFRVGLSFELFGLACDAAIAVILYELLRPVHRGLALLAALLRIANGAIFGLTAVCQVAALRLLKGGDTLSAFTTDQLQQLALLAMKLHGDGYAIALVFFGLSLLALGYLLMQSGYFPRLLGVLACIAGLGYVINSFVRFLAPGIAAQLGPSLLLPGFVAEVSLCLWLIFKGVDLSIWNERTART
jgi:hypothetical protein